MASNPDRLDAPSEDLTLAELLALFGRSLALDLRVSAPATVIAYPDAQGGATVQLGALPVALVRGEDVPQGPIILPGVPVAWYGGSGAYVSTPLPPGSTGWVIFADRAIGEWLEQGAPGDPLLGRTHALADGLFLPCRIGVSAPGVTSPAATVIEGPLVQIGAGAVQPAVLGTLEHTALNAYATAITAAVSTLAGLAATWAGIAGPAQIAYANGHAAFLTAVTAAQTALATALGPALSTTVTVR